MTCKEVAILLAEDICDVSAIVSLPFRSVPFARLLTHRYSQQAQDNLYTADSHEDSLWTGLCQIVVPVECQAEGEHVLEDHHACEGFDGDLTCDPLVHHDNRRRT